MLLVQKPPQPPFSTLHSTHNHRRHPSAPPAVIVQPTRTPGLLSLSKPQPQRFQPPQRPSRTPVAAKSTPATVPTSPLPAFRGRQTADKVFATPRYRLVYRAPLPHQILNFILRSDSVVARRRGHRQPSPSQAEGPSTPPKQQPSPDSDPFLVSAASPTLTRPSGKLARRRQQQQQINPIPPFVPNLAKLSQPVSIPQTPKPAKPLSHSVPVPRIRSRNPKVALLPPWDFPICDDMTEAGDFPASESNSRSSPVTPARRNPDSPTRAHPKPPPFTPPYVSIKRRVGGRNHKRAPSDSGLVFNMSSDESGPESLADRDEELKNLLRGMSMATHLSPHTPPPREPLPQGYFASSMFQNSPSPEDLPDPLFV